MTPSRLNDDAKKAVRFVVAGKTRSKFVPAEYEGTLTLEDVKATVAQDSATVDVSNGSGEYQLTDGSAAPITITDLTNAVHRGVYTLLGSGGTYPSEVDVDATFILKDGTNWTATSGSSITLKAFKAGASDIVFFEISRSV